MSKTQIYLGTELLDFTGLVNVKRQVNDYRDQSIGSSNKSYTVELPLTPSNALLLKFINDIRSREEVTDTARIVTNGMELIRGKLRILSSTMLYAKVIVEADDWIDLIAGTSIKDLSWASGDAHDLTTSNVSGSWTAAAGAFYRYPLINFCQATSGDTGQLGTNLHWNDFYPMWNIQDIVSKMLLDAGYTLDTGGFLNSTFGQKLYILSAPIPADDDHILEKAMKAYVDDDADNEDSETIPAGDPFTLTFNQRCVFGAEDEDENGDFSTSTYLYTAPEDGTYRFLSHLEFFSEAHQDINFTVSASTCQLTYKVNGTTIVSTTWSGTSIFDSGNEFELDSGYIYMEASDYIELVVAVSVSATNGYGISKDCEIYVMNGVDTSYIQAIWDEWCLWPGLNQSISPADFLPDIESTEFLKALKQAFNLRFWADRMNKTVYCETADDFIGSEVIDWSDKIDYSEDIEFEIASASHKEKQLLGWAEDSGDQAYENYVSAEGKPFQQEITLESEYTEPGLEEIINPIFASCAEGYMHQVGGNAADAIPRIWGGADFVSEIYRYPEYRAKQWSPRLLQWNGLTAFDGAGNFDWCTFWNSVNTNYTTFPEARTPDMADMYDDYWFNDYRRIDKNKIVTCTLVLTPSEIMKFMTVVGTAANEGFRATYLLNIEGKDMYFICSKITTDGDRVKAEFIQKL